MCPAILGAVEGTALGSGDVSADPSPPVFGPDDDGFHRHLRGDDWWFTETSWFSFHHVERNLGGWFYTMARHNIGTVAGGAWVWDDTAHLPWEVLYSSNLSAVELPVDTDLRRCELPTGVAVRFDGSPGAGSVHPLPNQPESTSRDQQWIRWPWSVVRWARHVVYPMMFAGS